MYMRSATSWKNEDETRKDKHVGMSATGVSRSDNIVWLKMNDLRKSRQSLYSIHGAMGNDCNLQSKVS